MSDRGGFSVTVRALLSQPQKYQMIRSTRATNLKTPTQTAPNAATLVKSPCASRGKVQINVKLSVCLCVRKTRSFTTDLPYSRSELIHHWTSHPRTYTIYHLCSAYVCYIVNIHKWGKKNDVRSWATGDALQHFPDWPAVGGVMYVNKNAERRWPCRSAAVPHSGSASSDQLMGSTRHNAGGGLAHPYTMQSCKNINTPIL